MHPELNDVPAVAHERARVSGAAQRCRLAEELRRTARHRPPSPRERRRSPYPPERLAAARRGLLDLADGVEAAVHVDPALVVEIRTLLRDGTRSPLLNADIPASELSATLRRARFRLATEPAPPAGGTAAPAVPAVRPADWL